MFGAAFAVILTLFLVVGLHELGHALAAWSCGIKIKRVAIGFGKPVIQWTTSSGCEWVVGVWLLGGYVRLNDTRNGLVPAEDKASCFDQKPTRIKLMVLLAGVAINGLVAWFALIGVYYWGLPYRAPEVALVQPDSVAAYAGLRAQDQFIAVNAKKTRSWEEVGQSLLLSWGEKTIPVVIRTSDGVVKTRILNLEKASLLPAHSLLASLGISPDKKAPVLLFHSPSLRAAIQDGSDALVHLSYFYLMLLKQLLWHELPWSFLLGPWGLFVLSIQSFSEGLSIFAYFIAELSLVVALLNVLPVPGLDGGAIVYALLEKVRGRPISIAWEILLYRFTLIALFLLLVQLLKNDWMRLYLMS